MGNGQILKGKQSISTPPLPPTPRQTDTHQKRPSVFRNFSHPHSPLDCKADDVVMESSGTPLVLHVKPLLSCSFSALQGTGQVRFECFRGSRASLLFSLSCSLEKSERLPFFLLSSSRLRSLCSSPASLTGGVGGKNKELAPSATTMLTVSSRRSRPRQ